MCLSQALSVVASYWLAYWGTVSTRGLVNGEPLTVTENTYFLNYYALYTMMGVVALTVRAIVLAEHRMGTSILMHEVHIFKFTYVYMYVYIYVYTYVPLYI
jgi:hypothetical protein